MSDYTRIYGQYRKFWTDDPLANARLTFFLLANSFTLDAGYPTTAQNFGTQQQTDTGRPVDLDENGELPEDFELFATEMAVGGVAVMYKCVEPDGFSWSFVLPKSDTPISIHELRAGGQPVTPPDTIISLIRATLLGELFDVDFDELEDGDAVVWNASTEKFVNQPIEGGTGGSIEYLDELNDVAITSPSSGNFIQFIAGLWVNRTVAQVKTSLGISVTTDGLTEGTTNKYFTTARVLEVVLTGVSFVSDTAISAADSVLTALGKLQAQISDLFTSKAEKRVEYADDITTTSFSLDGTMLGKIQPCSNDSDITVSINDDLGGGFNVGLLKTSAATNKILFIPSGDVTLIFPTGHSKSDSFRGAFVSIHTPDGHDFYISGATAA